MKNYKYVPILKWKQGEQGSLKFLEESIKDSIIPLIQITPDLNLSKFSSTMLNWENRLFYFDMLPECYEQYDGSIYFSILNQCDSQFVIPVLNIDDEQDVIEKALIYSKNGIALRVSSADFNEDLDAALEKLNLFFSYVSPSNIDLIIDSRYIDIANVLIIESILNNIIQIGVRRLVISASSFPQTLTKCIINEICLLPRHEFSVYKKIISKFSEKTKSEIIFSDYAVSHPDYLEFIPGMIPSFNIRYSDEKNYIILKGSQIKKGGLDSDKVTGLCNLLVSSKYFKGNDYSWGDEYIGTRTDGQKCGNLTTWRKVGTNHHITLVVNQLSNLLDV
jgi:hypothetical protein